MNNTRHKVKGRNTFQAKFINLSYRYRGKVVRAQTQTQKILQVPRAAIKSNLEETNKSLVTIDKRRILPYSDINSNANPPLPYSVLNPETNSDSPSEKSKGVRLDSAMPEISHKVKAGVARESGHEKW